MRLLIDTDPGIDDALALLLALAPPAAPVEAITAVAGNVPVDLAVQNVFRILDIARPTPVPGAARGATAPLKRDPRRLGRAGRFVVMGGAVAAPGNVTPAAEFNFYVDPEAAALVFDAGLPLELVPLDVTH